MTEPADLRNYLPLFTLPELRRACVLAFLRGQRRPDAIPEAPMPEAIDAIVDQVVRERK